MTTLREAQLDAEHIFNHNRQTIINFHKIGLAQGMARPYVFVLDLRCELARRLVDEYNEEPGYGEAMRASILAGAPGSIPTMFFPLDHPQAVSVLDQVLLPEDAETVAGRPADRDETIAVLITGNAAAVRLAR